VARTREGPPVNHRLTEDDRYQLAGRAEASTRANRPTHLVAIALVVLAVAVLGVLVGWRSDSSASRELSRRSAELAQINERADRLTELTAQLANTSNAELNRPIPDMLSRLQNLAREAGLATLPDVPRTDNEAFDNARRVNYRYDARSRNQVRDASLEKLLTWVNLVTERIPGMHVRQISLTPQANAWSMEVTFARYERLE